MKRENKKAYSPKLLVLAVISLIIILIVVLAGTFSGHYRFWLKKWNGSVVLGISDKLTFPKSDDMEKILEGAVSKTREEVGKKMTESQEVIKSKLEKEISSMTDSQIKNFQRKLCQDWGIE